MMHAQRICILYSNFVIYYCIHTSDLWLALVAISTRMLIVIQLLHAPGQDLELMSAAHKLLTCVLTLNYNKRVQSHTRHSHS